MVGQSPLTRFRIVGLELPDLTFDIVPRGAVAPLKQTDQLIPLAGDDIEIVVGELAPLFPNLSLGLLPAPFEAVPVQKAVSTRKWLAKTKKRDRAAPLGARVTPSSQGPCSPRDKGTGFQPPALDVRFIIMN